MAHLTVVDYAIIGGYFLILLVIGVV